MLFFSFYSLSLIFFYGGKLFYVNRSINKLFLNTPGLGKASKKILISRLELENCNVLLNKPILEISSLKNQDYVGFLNRFFSQVSSVNSTLHNLVKLNIIRLYLVKSYRGRCHLLGKPVKSQRTWSNA
jgi:ribosomal protein S13